MLRLTMTFRRDAKVERAKQWRRWIAAHRADLERIGLPLAVYCDPDHWDDFLENGHLHYHDDGPPFDVAELNREQVERLRALLEADPCHSREPLLLGWLRHRLARNAG